MGGRSTAEDAYAYAKFARMVLGTNDIDFRARPHSAEEADFLAAHVAGRQGVSYADFDSAPVVVLAGFEPEDESPIVFLRLRKAVRKHGIPVLTVASWRSRGSEKLNARLIATVPGGEARALDRLAPQLPDGSIILLGERLATSPGALSAAARLVRGGKRLAWIPRRAGERGALDTGCLPNLLPGGRPVADPVARQQIADSWRLDGLPDKPGRDTTGILEAAAHGDLEALLIGGLEPGDLPDPQAALAAIGEADFVVSLEIRESEVTALADVVFPVAPVAEKAGIFLNWEGRLRSFDAALSTNATPDLRVLQALADELGVDLGFRTSAEAREDMTRLGLWNGTPAPAPDVCAEQLPHLQPDEAVLAGWRNLLDAGRLQDGEPYLAGTARLPVARMSATTAARIGATDVVIASTGRGYVSMRLEVTEMPDGVVWLPLNATGSPVHRLLGVTTGAVVHIEAGGLR